MSKDNDNAEELNVFLTDIAWHKNPARNPKAWQRGIEKAKRKGEPGRVYAKVKEVRKEDGSIAVVLNVPLQVNGKRIKLNIPEGGIPMTAGDDLIEHINAKKKRENKRTRTWYNRGKKDSSLNN